MTKREHYPVDKTRTREWLDSIKEFTKHTELKPENLKSSALLVIDMQNFFIDEDSHASFPSAREIIPNIKKLVAVFFELDKPVIFTRHALADGEEPGVMAQWWKDTVSDNTPEAEIYPGLELPAGSTVLRKTTYDAFHNTELGSILMNNGVSSVVITGVMTHLCCETTARTAFVNDLHVYFVIDATGTINEELHLSTLKTLSDGFAVPVTTDALINELKKAIAGGN